MQRGGFARAAPASAMRGVMNFAAAPLLFAVARRGPRRLVVTTYNAVVALRNRIHKAWANIDVALKQRHDMLPSLVDAVRGIMAFEQDVLEEVTARRAACVRPTTRSPARRRSSEATTAAVRSLFAVVEAYPELKSAGNVLDAPGRDRAARGRSSPTGASSTTTRSSATTRGSQQLPATLFAGVFGWTRRRSSHAEEARAGRPEVDIRPA